MEDTNYSDVLVIGAGPTGLMTALLLHRAGVHDLAIIDRRAIRVQVGHAGGLQPRTCEILQTLGILQKLQIGSGGVADTAFWAAASPDEPLKRTAAAPEVTNESPYKTLVIQHQGRTEEVLNAELDKRGVNVKRPFEFLDYEYTDNKVYPICAYVKDMERGQVDRYHCKYLVAADGANSRTRETAGIESTVNQTDATWVVCDCTVETDFPDFRRRSAIRTTEGNLMLIPSPNDSIRIYNLLTRKEDLEELEESAFDGPKRSGKPKKNRTTLLDILQKRVPPILKPYTMKIKHVDWISQYVVAQKVIKSFSDDKNLLLVGDSCHSHSPKAAQGMNTGMQDAYNLSWKLALVLRGRARPELLESYNFERKHIAHQLIVFDEKFAALFGDQSKINSPEFHDTWKSSQGFTSGLGQQYPPNALVADNGKDAKINEEAVDPLVPGKRFLPMSLTRHIDGFEIGSLDTMPANGEFFEIVFAGDISSEPRKSEFRKLYGFLISPQSVLSAYNGESPEGGWPLQDKDTNNDHPSKKENHGAGSKMLNLFVVHTAKRFDVELRPEFELWKYNLFEDAKGIEHTRHGVDPTGPMQVAIVRPDGIVGMVRTADEGLGKEVHRYFEVGGIVKAQRLMG